MKITPLVAMLFCPAAALSQTNVLTYHYDNARTGQNTQEPFLSPANVRPNQFRKLFSQSVDGDLYAQPLYVENLPIPGKGVHNVVFVATEGDSVYAFDADNNAGANASPLWKTTFVDGQCGSSAARTTVCSSDLGNCEDTFPQTGITSTPAIDLSSRTMYVVSLSKENGSLIYRLHAVDITTGNDAVGNNGNPVAPVVINGTVNGIPFVTASQHNRPGILLSNGLVYAAFGSHCDNSPFHGWIFSYDAATLAPRAVFLTTPNGDEAGIWMEGSGPAADAGGNLYVATGNGTFAPAPNTTNGFQDFGDSIVKLPPNFGKLPTDYFTPYNQHDMDTSDGDLGSGGVLLLPDQPGNHPHLLVQAGKGSTIYVVDRDNMGHFCSTCTATLADTNIVQVLPNGLRNTPVPVYWNNGVYFRGDQDVLRAFSLINGKLTTTPITTPDPADSYSGRISISANGNDNGIVWSLNTSAVSPNRGAPAGPTVLNAYDAVSLSQLYSSAWAGNRDTAGGAVKFSSPIVANGKVYVGTSGQLNVFSLFGIGGYDLESGADRSFAFDYNGSGKLDHLALYRPGTGTIWILKNNAGTFTPIYQQGDPGNGIGGYDLKSSADRVFPFDYDSSGRLDHLVLYRPGTGTIWILKNNAGIFTAVYQQGAPGSGIGGYDLASAEDRIIPFDYDGSGKLDHLDLYRPGTGTIWILKNNAGSFTPVYQQGDPGSGIGGYDLASAADRVIPFDYDGSGKLDHLVLFRPGASTISILKDSAGTFAQNYAAW